MFVLCVVVKRAWFCSAVYTASRVVVLINEPSKYMEKVPMSFKLEAFEPLMPKFQYGLPPFELKVILLLYPSLVQTVNVQSSPVVFKIAKKREPVACKIGFPFSVIKSVSTVPS